MDDSYGYEGILNTEESTTLDDIYDIMKEYGLTTEKSTSEKGYSKLFCRTNCGYLVLVFASNMLRWGLSYCS